MQKQPLSLKQKLAWQGVGFVIGSIMFALAGGLDKWIN